MVSDVAESNAVALIFVNTNAAARRLYISFINISDNV